MAGITVDFRAPEDPRLKVLAKSMCVSYKHVFTDCCLIWIHCTDRETYFLSADIIDALTDHEGFAEKMAKAGLAELQADGLYRIKGTGGRIEWLAEKRSGAKKGGEKRAQLAKRGDSGSFISGSDQPSASHQLGDGSTSPPAQPSPSTSSSPSSSSSSSSRKKKEELNLPAHPSGERGTGKSIATWEAYREAYQRRYGIPPIRNATINGQLAQLVKRLGEQEAPLVAAFYLTHNDAFYVRSGHPVGLLLKDAEKLRTEHFRKKQMTGTEARQIERKQATVNAFASLLAEAEEKEAGHG